MICDGVLLGFPEKLEGGLELDWAGQGWIAMGMREIYHRKRACTAF